MSEILAPVGGPEQLYAAVRCGTDAVYLGTKDFNARRNADNFDYEELADAVRYCHVRDVKVYVTVNTLVYDDELFALSGAAENIAAAGVDGVIIQDLAVLKLFRECYPDIARIASTQMAVHNADGARMIEELGFDTLVLARELSKEEIIDILASTHLKTEVFVHGAHCMSLSGACYISSMLGGRSGNRGLCAQPCRLDWKCGEKDHVLSLKDLSLLSYLKELEEIGVDSFKIEGRMKRPEYVASVVAACRSALNGEAFDTEKLEAVFSRSGFSDGYYKGNISGSMFGIRTKDDVLSSASVLKDISQTYSKERPLVPVDAYVSVKKTGTQFSLCDSRGNSVSVYGKGAEDAIRKPTSYDDVKSNASKLGGTPYYINDLDIEVQDDVYLPLSDINRLRREAAELLTQSREYNRNMPASGDPFGRSADDRTGFGNELWARFSREDQIKEYGSFFDRYIIPSRLLIDENEIPIDKDKVIVELPPAVFPSYEKDIHSRLSILAGKGYKTVYANNIYGLQVAEDLGFEVHGGFGLNITNSEALGVLTDLGIRTQTVSFELSSQRIKEMKRTVPVSLIAYGRLPLMRYRSCPVKASEGCGKCMGSGKIRDRYGVEFPLECDERRTSGLLNSVPLYIFDRSVPDSEILIYWFTTETSDEIEHIIDLSGKNLRPDFDRTTGLYYREVF